MYIGRKKERESEKMHKALPDYNLETKCFECNIDLFPDP